MRGAIIDSPADQPQADAAIDRQAEPGERGTVTAPAPGSEPALSTAARRCVVATLLALFALQVLLTSRQTSPAYDEVSLLPAEYVFLKTGQWENLFPHHPPLIGAPSAVPLLGLEPRLNAVVIERATDRRAQG